MEESGEAESQRLEEETENPPLDRQTERQTGIIPRESVCVCVFVGGGVSHLARSSCH